MMINNKVIFEEVEELKHILSKGEVDIPSFWTCLWPGLVIIAWNALCSVISVDSGFFSSRYIFSAMIFPCGVGVIIMLGVASARSLFLSVPRTFRLNSCLYRFFGKKIMVYTITYMVVVVLFALFNRVYYNSPLPFAFMIVLTTICCGVVMNLDFGRYQLSLLTSAISTFKSNRLNN
ncbi:conjugal transfer protein TraS [Klebsiella aerogenes]|mgnify:CR=1 FL=1|nr:conjugal transfer protein TraS [Klebsiella aerogenes]HBV9946308.1 conjugal transfer protein TraS [Klebsiella aerogenes]HCM7228920.1 conjugal transfer protein TraS [Klebsiella aerogenes]HEO1574267.1 conjugal transfer protein TraS [Klebsiella aerogenes]